MNCPKCNNSMALLFTSFYCPHCEKEGQSTPSKQYPYTWYIAKSHMFSMDEVIGKRAKLFKTIDELKLFCSHNALRNYSILQVYATRELSAYTGDYSTMYPIVKGTPGPEEVSIIGEVEC